MGKVIADITMSLDGFITGPDDRPGRGLGERGECLHNWVMSRPWRYDDEGRRFAPAEVNRKVLDQALLVLSKSSKHVRWLSKRARPF